MIASRIQTPGYQYNTPAPGSLLGSGAAKKDFYLQYNFMDNAENFFNVSPQQLVYGGEPNPNGNLISYLSSTIKGNLKSADIEKIFLSEQMRDPDTGILFESDTSLLNLKSLQVEKLGYRSVDLNAMGSIEQEDITNSTVVLRRFIPYSSFVPAYKDKDKKDETNKLNALNNNGNPDQPVLMYGVSTYFYNQNYTQIIPYGVPDIYNNAKFIENAPKF